MFLDDLEIIVGTYEEFLLGYRPKYTDEVYNLTQTFASHGHKASVRCVASNGKKLASGGADDCIHLYDMVQRRETGILMHHNGTVSCVEYTPNGSHLLTGGDDGMLAILRASDFQLEKTWNSAHKSAILGISVHPTGKLALTVGADATLRTWNLVKGRHAYAIRVGSTKCGGGWQINGVCWNPTGKFYALGMGTKVDVYSVESAAIVYSVTTEMKASSFCFLSDNILCVGCESGMIYVHDVTKKSCLTEKKAHDQRVKGLRSLVFENHVCVVSASSSGQIIVWEYKGKAFHKLCSKNAGCRITCLTITKCGYPNVKEEEEVEIEVKEEVDDCLPERIQNIPMRPVRKEILVVEEEIEEDTHPTKIRKKKTTKHSRISLEIEEESERPMKKQKTKTSKASNSFNLKKKSDKKRKSSLTNSWEVSDVG